MPCGGCGKKSIAQFGGKQAVVRSVVAQRSAQPALSAMQAPNQQWPLVVYMGAAVNHYIVSPTRKIKHYGYGARGARISVHPDDVRSKPELFIPAGVAEAKKVWPDYPVGAPESVVSVLGTGQPPVTTTVPPESEEDNLPFGEPTEEQFIDPFGMTVAEIRKLVGLSTYQWEALLKAEKNGKARSSVINYVQDILETL